MFTLEGERTFHLWPAGGVRFIWSVRCIRSCGRMGFPVDLEKDADEPEAKEDENDVSENPAIRSPSLPPVSALIAMASSPSPITSVIPITSSAPVSQSTGATTALPTNASSSSAITSIEILPTSVSDDV
ncbi:hypothetical protein SK128_011932, partial [Halocaridina rubra]